MKYHATLFGALLVMSCGGRATSSADDAPSTDSQAGALVTYTIGRCVTFTTHACSPGPGDSCCSKEQMRESADTYSVLSDCTMVRSSLFIPGKPERVSKTTKLSASACQWLKSSITPELMQAVDDPTTCPDSLPGAEALDVWAADGRQHHKEWARHCQQPTLAWFRTGFGVHCVFGP